MRITSAASALPVHCYPQEVLTQALKLYWGDRLQNTEALERLHARVRVGHRYLAFPLERYLEFTTWGETNAAWLEASEALGEVAIDLALQRAGLHRSNIDALFVVSVTGIASPSLDARLINRMSLRRDIKRTPIFGVGCVGGALGLTRAADYVKAYPNHHAVLLAVETCSLTLMRDDFSTVNLIATGLFGDGAGAVVVSGNNHTAADSQHQGPEILGTGSYFYPQTENIMGWDISEAGFKIVLSPQLMEVIRNNLSSNVDDFLAKFNITRSEIKNWVIHTGGPHVLDAMQDALKLQDHDIQKSWDCLERVGNLSSASVLLVLEDVMTNDPPAPGTYGMLLAMGPGFCAEMILLKW